MMTLSPTTFPALYHRRFVARSALLLGFLALLLGFAHGSDNADPPNSEQAAANEGAADEQEGEGQQPSQRELERLVDQLGAPELERRDEAYRRLVDAGEAAIPVLENARRRGNPEIRWRAEKALELCRWGITTELSDVEQQLSAFLDGSTRQRESLLQMWSRAYGEAVVPFLRNVCLRDPARAVRRVAFTEILRVGGLDTEKMHELAEQVTRNDAGAGWPWIALARHHLEQDQTAEAVPCLERVKEMDPTNYEAHAMLAEIHRRDENWEEAARFHRLARELGRDDDSRLEHAQALADILLQLGRFEEAQIALEWLLESGNRTPATILTLLRFYFQHEMTDKALVLAEETLEDWRGRDARVQHFVQLLMLLIESYHDRGEYAQIAEYSSEMIAELERLISGRRMRMDRSLLVGPLLNHAWALRRAGEHDEARETLIRVGDYVGREDLASVRHAMRLAQAWREFEVLDSLHDRLAAISPARAHLMQAQLALDQDRNSEAAREHLGRAHEEALRDSANESVSTLLHLLSAWEAIGEDRKASYYLDRIVEHDEFHSRYYRARNEMPPLRASSDVLLFEAWAGNAGPRRQQLLIRRLAHDGRYEEALRLARRIDARVRNAEPIARLLLIEGNTAEALEHLESELGNSARPELLEALARLHIEELGQFEEGLELLDNAPFDIRHTEMEVYRLRTHMRLGHVERVSSEVEDTLEQVPERSARALQLRLLQAQAFLATGELDSAREAAIGVLEILRAAQEERRRGIQVRNEAIEAARILVDLGEARRVLEYFRPTKLELLRPMLQGDEERFQVDDWGRVRYLDEPQGALPREQEVNHVLACAYAYETLDQPVEALLAYLLAWRLALLDHQTDRIAERLVALATPQRLAAVCERLEDELVPHLGPSLREGGIPNEVRHTRLTPLRMLAHARALKGDFAGAEALLRYVLEHALENELPLLEQTTAPDPSYRGYNETRSVDIGVELVQLLLHPERTAGLSEARAEALSAELAGKRPEQKERGLAWCERLLEVWPHDMRMHALRIRAAELLGLDGEGAEHGGARESRRRIEAGNILDEWEYYVAAFHFLQHDYDELSEMLWRAVLEAETQEVHIQANGYEYLGRLLDREPRRREEAVELFRESDSRVSMEEWIIDEDGYEGLTYHARRMRSRVETLLEEGKSEEALRDAKRASVYWPANDELRLRAARMLAQAGRIDEASRWLRPLHARTTLRLRTAPGDDEARRLRHAIDRIPGVIFDPLPFEEEAGVQEE